MGRNEEKGEYGRNAEKDRNKKKLDDFDVSKIEEEIGKKRQTKNNLELSKNEGLLVEEELQNESVTGKKLQNEEELVTGEEFVNERQLPNKEDVKFEGKSVAQRQLQKNEEVETFNESVNKRPVQKFEEFLSQTSFQSCVLGNIHSVKNFEKNITNSSHKKCISPHKNVPTNQNFPIQIPSQNVNHAKEVQNNFKDNSRTGGVTSIHIENSISNMATQHILHESNGICQTSFNSSNESHEDLNENKLRELTQVSQTDLNSLYVSSDFELREPTYKFDSPNQFLKDPKDNQETNHPKSCTKSFKNYEISHLKYSQIPRSSDQYSIASSNKSMNHFVKSQKSEPIHNRMKESRPKSRTSSSNMVSEIITIYRKMKKGKNQPNVYRALLNIEDDLGYDKEKCVNNESSFLYTTINPQLNSDYSEACDFHTTDMKLVDRTNINLVDVNTKDLNDVRNNNLNHMNGNDFEDVNINGMNRRVMSGRDHNIMDQNARQCNTDHTQIDSSDHIVTLSSNIHYQDSSQYQNRTQKLAIPFQHRVYKPTNIQKIPFQYSICKTPKDKLQSFITNSTQKQPIKNKCPIYQNGSLKHIYSKSIPTFGVQNRPALYSNQLNDNLVNHDIIQKNTFNPRVAIASRNKVSNEVSSDVNENLNGTLTDVNKNLLKGSSAVVQDQFQDGLCINGFEQSVSDYFVDQRVINESSKSFFVADNEHDMAVQDRRKNNLHPEYQKYSLFEQENQKELYQLRGPHQLNNSGAHPEHRLNLNMTTENQLNSDLSRENHANSNLKLKYQTNSDSNRENHTNLNSEYQLSSDLNTENHLNSNLNSEYQLNSDLNRENHTNLNSECQLNISDLNTEMYHNRNIRCESGLQKLQQNTSLEYPLSSDMKPSLLNNNQFASKNILKTSSDSISEDFRKNYQQNYKTTYDFANYNHIQKSKYLFYSPKHNLFQTNLFSEFAHFISNTTLKYSWINIFDPNEQDLSLLATRFSIHDITISDIRERETEEKIDIFNNYYFISIKLFSDLKQKPKKDIDFNIILFKTFVITTHDNFWVGINDIVNFLSLLSKHTTIYPDWILFSVMIEFLQDLKCLKEEINQQIISLKETSLRNDTEMIDILKIKFTLDVRILNLKNLIKHKLKILISLRKKLENRVKISILRLLGEIKRDYKEQICEIQEMEKVLLRIQDLGFALVNMYQTQEANKMNKQMKWLTMIQFVFLPCQTVTGLWGMNVQVPGQNDHSLKWFWILCFIGPLISVLYILSKKILRKKHQKVN